MSVLKNLRSLSEMQFYKTAIAIRKELTVWLLKDFGAKRNVKSVNQVIKDISEDDQKTINGFVFYFMYERLLDLNNLHRAFLNCQKQVNWKTSVQKYEANELYNLNQLRKKLKNHTYRQRPFYEFDINERGKHRHIKMIAEKIKDKETIDLIAHLIGTFNTPKTQGKSVGIGSQVSQIAGIFYPTEIDNYCKIVKSCKYYGRYMDDTYILHHDKEFLKNLLNEIREKAERLGIIINEHKTQIIKLSNGFTFLKMRYLFTDTGKIIVKPCKKTITRERRKLRKLKKRMDAGLITQEEITEQYKSWRGNITKYNSYKSVRNTDALYKSLFGGELWQKQRPKKNFERSRNGGSR